jgi:D-sedoheptulose 7-phosphate isomerase
MDNFLLRYFAEAAEIARLLDFKKVELMVDLLIAARGAGGRLFILGVGGSAANASHAVNDFRKICGMEAYAPTDNVAELTARINDDTWESSYVEWLRGSHLRKHDIVLVFSVGGGDLDKKISVPIVRALILAKEVGAKIIGIVGRDGGHTAQVGDAVVVVPTISTDLVTPHTESFQAVVWHGIVSHPRLKMTPTKWESI